MIAVLLAASIVIGVAAGGVGIAALARSRGGSRRRPSAAQKDKEIFHADQRANQKDNGIACAHHEDKEGDRLSFSHGSQRETDSDASEGPADGTPDESASERSEAAPNDHDRPPDQPKEGADSNRDDRAPANSQAPPPTQSPDEESRDTRTRKPWVISGGIDGGGTHARIEVPAIGWASIATELLEHRGPPTTRVVAGVEVHVRRADGGVQLVAPGRALLQIHHDYARLVMPSEAVELRGGGHEAVAAWLDAWPPWASRVLVGRTLTREPDPEGGSELWAAGWRTGCLDIHLDTASIDDLIPDDWIVEQSAWSGRSARRRPHPDGREKGRLTGFWLGAKADTARGRISGVALHGYNKSLEQRETRHPSPALDAIWAARGYIPEEHGDVWRWEFSLQRDALVLRSGGRPLEPTLAEDLERADPEQADGWNLEDPASWADPEAIAAAWAYLVGFPGVQASGVVRLTAEGDEREPKRRDVHPIWEVLRTPAAAAPRERLTQARAVELEQGARRERAEARVGRALGQLAGVVGAAESPARAGHFAVAVVPQIVQRDDWAGHVAAGRVDHADLHEQGEP